MEEIHIIDIDHWHWEDFDELNIRIKPWSSDEYIDPVDDQANFFLQLTAETDEVTGATIFEADHWFVALADAFARRDLDHPDVRFFFEQKIKVLAECWRAEQQSATPNPVEESAMLTEAISG